MGNLTPDTIRDIFRKIVDLRGEGKSYKQRVMDKVRRTEENEHMQKLAGLTEAPGRAKDIANSFKRKFGKFTDRGEVTVDDLYNAWEENGKPNNMQHIVKLLQGFNFTDGEIDKAFKLSGIEDEDGDDENITKLAKGIRTAGITDQVLKHLRAVNEALLVEIMGEEIFEAPVTNKAIKDTFLKVADSIPEPEPEEEEPEEDEQGTLIASVDMSDQAALTEMFASTLGLVEEEQLGRKRRV